MTNLDNTDLDELDLLSDTFWLLHQYATLKAHSMRQRLKGSIQKAMGIERELEKIYKDLPKEHRW